MPHLLRATGILFLPQSIHSRFPSATSSLAHPFPLNLTFLSFATLVVFSALSCFLLSLLTRSFALAPLQLLLPQSLIATLHKAVELLHRPPPLSRLPSDAFHPAMSSGDCSRSKYSMNSHRGGGDCIK